MCISNIPTKKSRCAGRHETRDTTFVYGRRCDFRQQTLYGSTSTLSRGYAGQVDRDGLESGEVEDSRGSIVPTSQPSGQEGLCFVRERHTIRV